MATSAKSKTITTALSQDQGKASSLENGVLSFLFTVFRQVSIFGGIYMIGYMNWSIAWVIAPVVLSVAREQHRKSANSMRKIATDTDKEVLLAHVDELPTWVYFPDVDRCEWLNCIVRHLWPCASHYVRDLVKNEVEPHLKYSLGQYHVKGFGFDNVILGAVPPRIAGIKVYEKNIRNEIIMDLELYYCSSCDITFHLGSIRSGIKDFHLHCYARVVLKPLISNLPLVGGMQICLLRYPEIDFTMAGILELADLPFFGDLIRKLIAEQIAAVMVLPNKFSVILSDHVPSMDVKMSEPEGILRIHIIGAKNLTRGDFKLMGKNRCDPYAVVYIGAEKFETEVKEKDYAPTWDYWCDAKVFAEMGQTVVFEVWCKDKNKTDDFMGRVTVDLRSFIQKVPVEKWLQLEDVKSGNIHVSMQWYKLSRNPDHIKAALQDVIRIRQPRLSAAVVTVFIERAQNLKQAQSDALPNPYVQCCVNNKCQETTTIQHCNNPLWEEAFSFLVEDPYQETLLIKVKDRKTESDIGECEVFLVAILECENLQTNIQSYHLRNSNSDSKLAMALSLKILAHFEATDPLYFECYDYSEENVARKVEEIKRKQPPTWMPAPAPFQYDSVTHSKEKLPAVSTAEQKFPVAKEKLTEFPTTTDKILSYTRLSHPALMAPTATERARTEPFVPERSFPRIKQECEEECEWTKDPRFLPILPKPEPKRPTPQKVIEQTHPEEEIEWLVPKVEPIPPEQRLIPKPPVPQKPVEEIRSEEPIEWIEPKVEDHKLLPIPPAPQIAVEEPHSSHKNDWLLPKEQDPRFLTGPPRPKPQQRPKPPGPQTVVKEEPQSSQQNEWLVPKEQYPTVPPTPPNTPRPTKAQEMVLPVMEERDASIVLRPSSDNLGEVPDRPLVTVLQHREPPAVIESSPANQKPTTSKKGPPLLKYTTSIERRQSLEQEKIFEFRVSTLAHEQSASRIASVSKMPNPKEPTKIELSMRYSYQREKLVVIVHKVINIPMSDPHNLPDPFVKLYLIPGRNKKTKRTTHVIRENCNPIYDETFEYDLTLEEVTKLQLEVSVCSQKDLMTDPHTVFGVVVIPLDNSELRKGILDKWYELKLDSRRSK